MLEETRVVRCGLYWKCGGVEGELVLEMVNDGGGALLELRGGVGGLCTGAYKICVWGEYFVGVPSSLLRPLLLLFECKKCL